MGLGGGGGGQKLKRGDSRWCHIDCPLVSFFNNSKLCDEQWNENFLTPFTLVQRSDYLVSMFNTCMINICTRF